jgi:hypothetical protein
LGRGQDELKYGARRLIVICPQPTLMGVDNGPADRQPYSDSTGFCRVEGVENPLEVCLIDPWS